MISTTRKRVLVASIAGIALIGSGVGTAALASAGDSPSTSTSAATTSGGDMVATVGNDASSNDGTTGQTGTEPQVSEQRAIEIAKTEVPGTVTEVELDDDDGRLHWEIEIDGKDNREHDLDIAANDGTILSHDTDDDDDDDRDDDDRDDDDDQDDDRDDRDDDDDDRDDD